MEIMFIRFSIVGFSKYAKVSIEDAKHFNSCRVTDFHVYIHDNTCKFDKLTKRLKKELAFFCIEKWQMNDGTMVLIRQMTDQHIENSLRWFFENCKWQNRKEMIKFLWLEKKERIKRKSWNINAPGTKLGKKGKTYGEEVSKFMLEFHKI
jgi:hypothetical protein